MGLPDSDGIETVTQLVEINSHLPIIALTGRDDDDIGLETIRAGASDFIPKGALSKSVIATGDQSHN